MFDLRYHVASLAAVFVALVIGIFVGVGLSGRGFVNDAERKNFEARISELQADRDSAEATAKSAARRGDAPRIRPRSAADDVEIFSPAASGWTWVAASKVLKSCCAKMPLGSGAGAEVCRWTATRSRIVSTTGARRAASPSRPFARAVSRANWII